MTTSYSDLVLWRQCPRLFAFTKLGYESAEVNEPMTTGEFAHAGIAAHFKGEIPVRAMEVAQSARLKSARIMLGNQETYEFEKLMFQCVKRAYSLVDRYIAHWAKDYEPILVEPELELDGVVCHPDLIADYHQHRCVVAFNPSYHPDERWYDVSNQTDLYAYVYIQSTSHRYTQLVDKEPVFRKEKPETIEMIVYDIISEEGIFRHQRPPRLSAGKKLFKAVQRLNDLGSMPQDDFEIYFQLSSAKAETARNELDPHFVYTCPSRCDFFGACFILETDTWESCQDYLKDNYLK